MPCHSIGLLCIISRSILFLLILSSTARAVTQGGICMSETLRKILSISLAAMMLLAAVPAVADDAPGIVLSDAGNTAEAEVVAIEEAADEE